LSWCHCGRPENKKKAQDLDNVFVFAQYVDGVRVTCCIAVAVFIVQILILVGFVEVSLVLTVKL